MRLRIGCQSLLVESRQQNRCCGGLGQAPHIPAGKFDHAAGAGVCSLARSNLLSVQADARAASRQGHRSGRNVSPAVGHLEAEAVCDFVSLRLMHFDQSHFLGLVGNGLARADAGPIKNVEVVQPAFRLEELGAPHGRLGRNLRGLCDERQTCLFLPQVVDLAHSYHLVFRDGVCDIHPVRIAGLLHGRLHFDIEISTIQIIGGNAISIVGHVSGGERDSRVQLKSLGRGQLFVGDVLIAFDPDIFDQSLGTFLDFESNVDFGFVINCPRSYFDLLVAVIAIESLDIFRALMQQLFAQASMSPDV